MRAGPMRDRIDVQSIVEDRDSYGQKIQSWATVGTYWADIRPLSGRELANAQQVKAEVTHSIRMRFALTLDPTMRVLFGTRVFHPHAILNINERNREYQLLCQELPGTIAGTALDLIATESGDPLEL